MTQIYKVLYLVAFINYSHFSACSTKKSIPPTDISGENNIRQYEPGALQTDEYIPYLKNKRVALVVNQTSVVGRRHLADTLKTLEVDIRKIFSPEHGFRGHAEAGETVKNGIDSATGISIVSLYGKNKKPSAESMADIDVVVFDIQDVGARFFTYISTMHYIMEACAENNKTMLILDRPNPHGYYVDGPVLEKKHKSFIGMHPIPIVHGLTVAELALMINGEKWLDSARVCSLKIVKVKNYTHKDKITIPIWPSPNLPNEQSVRLYPSLCLFEGTDISVGRGTYYPFQVIGSPNKANGSFTFVPKSIPGMAKNPPHEGKVCYGLDLREADGPKEFSLKPLIDFYNKAENKEAFFTSFFTKLAGNEILKTQIVDGMSEEKIRDTWKKDLQDYMIKRKKYLLYSDF